MITVKCTCGETYHADEQHVGRRIRCQCGNVLEIIKTANSPDVVGPEERSASSSRDSSDGSADPYLRRTATFTARQWVIGASVAGILLLSWGVYLVANAPQGENSTASVRHAPAAVPAPVATLQPVPPPCPPEARIHPRSGTELGGQHRGGLGRLQVANGTDSDAVAVLIDDATETPRRAIFIRSGELGAVTSVPSGRYRLRFQLGTDWLAERRFCRIRGTSEFSSAFDFQEIESDKGTRYSAYEVTLHPVPQGTARTHAVSDSRFELPPL